MDYLKQDTAFERWCENNYLPTFAYVIWKKLFKRFNRCRWSEWVTVDNLTLMAEVQIKSEKSFILYRDMLMNAGLVIYKKGKKGSPNQYKLVQLYEEKNTSLQEVQTTVHSTVEMTVEPPDISKHKNNKQNSSADENAGDGDVELPLPKETDKAEKPESVKNSNVIVIDVHAEFEKAYKPYPNKEGKADGKKLYIAYLTNGREINGQAGKVRFNHAQLRVAIIEFARQMESEGRERDKIKHFSTFMNTAVIDYVEKSVEVYEATMLATYGENWRSLKFEYNLKK